MGKEKLEILLNNIQELKSEDEGLVGTKEIYELIRNREAIQDRPIEISDKINKELKITYEHPTYLATPERITGFIDYLTMIEFKFINYTSVILFQSFLKEENGSTTNIPNYIAKTFNSNLFKDLNELKNCLTDYKKDSEEIKNYLMPFFSRASFKKIKSDKEFGDIIYHLFNEEYSKIENNIPKKLENLVSEYMKIFFYDISANDWTIELSRKKYLEYLEEEISIENENKLVINNMIKRMIEDKVEHKFEYRRRLLSHVLKDWHDNGYARSFLFESLIEKYENSLSWEAITKYYDHIINKDKEHLEELKSKECKSKVLKNFISIKGLNGAIKKMEENIKHDILIRRFLGQDKNWVERMLRS